MIYIFDTIQSHNIILFYTHNRIKQYNIIFYYLLSILKFNVILDIL